MEAPTENENHLLLADESLPSSQSDMEESHRILQDDTSQSLFETVSLDSEASNQVEEDGSILLRSGKRKRGDGKAFPNSNKLKIANFGDSQRRRTSPRFNLSAVLKEERNKDPDNLLPPLVMIKKEPQVHSFSLSEIQVPESCSLFSTVPLSWRVEHPSISSVWAKVGSPLARATPLKNGIWLKPTAPVLNGKDMYVLIELHEKSIIKGEDSQVDAFIPSPKSLVEFCDKCGSKRKEVIELQEEEITKNHEGVFEASIAINEQCAHRSDNDYGSPNTRFFLVIQLLEKLPPSNPQQPHFLKRLAHSHSSLIKVVAPGKNKPSSTAPTNTNTQNHPLSQEAQVPVKSNVPKKIMKGMKGKLNVKQIMETFIVTINTLNDRISKLEKQSHFYFDLINVLTQPPAQDIQNGFEQSHNVPPPQPEMPSLLHIKQEPVPVEVQSPQHFSFSPSPLFKSEMFEQSSQDGVYLPPDGMENFVKTLTSSLEGSDVGSFFSSSQENS